jgi:hypothetical protein
MLRKDGDREERTKMKSKQTTLLAGIAALALIAGSGFASAQEGSKSESGKSAAPHAAQQMNHGATTSQSSQGAQAQERGAMSKQGQRAEDGKASSERATGTQSPAQKEEPNRSAQSNEKKGTTAGNNESQAGKAMHERNESATENERGNRSNNAQEREPMGSKNAAERNRSGNTAAEQQNHTGGTAAEQQNRKTNAQGGRPGMEGLQGNASGMNVQLNEKQRNEIRTTVINGHGAPRVSHVDFDVTVGTVIPRSEIHVVPVPEMLVRIEPEWRGFLYFVYEDEIVIVNPNDMKIVAVVPV